MKHMKTMIWGMVTALGLAAAPVSAQTFPERPITMVIPLGAGGSHDLNARVITSVLPQILGQPVVVQLMPGAGGQTGTAAAAAAPADGYTLLFTHNFIDELQQFVTTLPYTPNEDFVAVSRTNTAQPVLVVRNDSPFQTFEELVEHGRENPGDMRFGHSGNWGAFMVPGLALMQEAGVDVTLIPYQGGGPVIQALLAGDVDFTFAFPSVLSGQDLRALLVVGEDAILDGIPTTTELGYDLVSEIGVMHRVVLAPAGTPDDRLEVLRNAFAQLNEDPTYLQLLQRLDENSAMMDGAEYNNIRLEQAESYRALVESFTQ
ncbi:Bug family tripartite tricarboxylate transporter substrate binding protein [Roseicitreum antarcticum]|uniref:Tripartite-type tricarboxylate transporter, receptor component TctC n=1 Tax=Roseicitreum antarcticum TaxID=564137 RepID=A0A1H3AJI6_9RHOB|nr:tripartite tricarboxylate transporter substrate binding protein [Roseicitreum antarcticum]SDX29783.1 Tripartite-type tricarboxylate transporter, receptor component TctC [Roseicitreum antarcticum]